MKCLIIYRYNVLENSRTSMITTIQVPFKENKPVYFYFRKQKPCWKFVCVYYHLYMNSCRTNIEIACRFVTRPRQEKRLIGSSILLGGNRPGLGSLLRSWQTSQVCSIQRKEEHRERALSSISNDRLGSHDLSHTDQKILLD